MEPNISAPPFNFSTPDQDPYDLGLISKLGGLVSVLAMASLYGGVAVQVYRKHRYDLEPLHILEINSLASFSVSSLIRAVKPLVISQLSSPVICTIIQWFTFYCKMNISVGIIMSQVDRFLALYLHVKYKSKVTPEMAKVRFKFSRLVSR